MFPVRSLACRVPESFFRTRCQVAAQRRRRTCLRHARNIVDQRQHSWQRLVEIQSVYLRYLHSVALGPCGCPLRPIADSLLGGRP
jgi:hypothetical protein